MKVGKLSRHAEWLSLIEISGPFLTVSMLEKAFPQGLEAVETPRRQMLRAAYDEWREAVDQQDELLSELHREWVRLVLTEMLEYDHESLVHADDWPDDLPSVSSQEHTGTFKPDWIVRSPADAKPRLFIAVLPPDTDLESVQRGDDWPVSLQERMTLLCRAHDVRVGLLTDGERWMLVNAPVGSTSSQASWYARLWSQEPITLKAFQSLLGVRRCFGPTEDTLESLLDESLKHHEEVTDTLGEQVRRAVEVLVQCLDKADEDRNRELLHDVKPVELYEAGLTVMMRLVFVLCAEERGLLLLGDSVYDRCYAVSTLRGQLAEEADRYGPEVLDRRHDAWARLLAVFRAVFGGIEHESLRMPALGGSLFDPDRFPFLEGRAKGTSWRDTSAAPLPIDNRTVLLLLNSLQILEQSGGALLLSYRALDVEQIGHVYEGLLEHTVARVPRVTLGLQGSQKAKNPNVALAELESARLDGDAALVKLVLDVTGRSESAIRNGLSKPADDTIFGRVLGVCGGDTELAERIRPFTNLLRTDAWDDPIVYRANSFMVTLGADRRETGTHYTPKSLTESIVTTTLEPVVYVGPAEGKAREEWTLKSSREILDLKVCDPAMGSGAFLVQACRYLGEKLVEAWLHEESAGKAIIVDGAALDQLGAEEPLPSQLDERLTIARRLVAERCLYGVDINPLAVELAKLSIWLVTLAKGRPFGFLDHNLRSGDSLLGIHRLDQLTHLSMTPESGQYQFRLFGETIKAAVNEALGLRKRLRTTTIRDIKDVEAMARLDREARQKLESVGLIADSMIGEALRCGGNASALDTALDTLATMAGDFWGGNERMGEQIACQTKTALVIGLPEDRPPRKPFHWAIEFPEVFKRGGFDGMVGNPPFLGNRLWKGIHGETLQLIVQMVLGTAPGKIDLCVAFHRRAADLLRGGGTYGLLATSNIAEGSAISVGLGVLVGYGDIYFARKAMPWPGTAAVNVAVVAFYKGSWSGFRDADGESCERIGARLEAELTDTWEPQKLAEEMFAFEGVHNGKGQAFLVTPENPWFSRLKQEANSLLRPYITGDDINSYALRKIDRWALDVADRSLEEIKQNWPVAYQFLLEDVEPTRTPSALKSYKGLIDRWWQFWNHRADLMRRLRQKDTFVAFSKVTKYPICMPAPTDWIYTNKIVLIEMSRTDCYAICLSSFFRNWLEAFSGGRLEGRLSLSITESVSKFPFPSIEIPQIGTLRAKQFNELSVAFSEKTGSGMTDVMNAINAPTNTDPTVIELRQVLADIDTAVATAFGWTDLEIIYDFRSFGGGSTKDNWRWAVADKTTVGILDRLTKLNRQRYEQEVEKGLHGKAVKLTASRAPRTKRPTKTTTSQPSFDFDAGAASITNNTSPASTIIDFLSGHDGWHAKATILSATGITDGQWNAVIKKLIEDGKVERQGEKRGARYRARL